MPADPCNQSRTISPCRCFFNGGMKFQLFPTQGVVRLRLGPGVLGMSHEAQKLLNTVGPLGIPFMYSWTLLPLLTYKMHTETGMSKLSRAYPTGHSLDQSTWTKSSGNFNRPITIKLVGAVAHPKHKTEELSLFLRHIKREKTIPLGFMH
jgi:hypothetical protein